MKKLIPIIFILLLAHQANAQVSRTIDVQTPGDLSGMLSVMLSTNGKATLTNLTITGNLDARDFQCIQEELTSLAVLDISAISIKSYTGIHGIYWGYATSYPADEFPTGTFNHGNTPYTTLKSISLPTSITSIGDNAFQGCSGLTQLTIPEKVKKIGWAAFLRCTSLNSIVIQDAVTSILTSAFSTCSSLTTITIGSGLLSIGNAVFNACDNLTTIYMSGNFPPVLDPSWLGPPTVAMSIPRTVYVPLTAYGDYKVAAGWNKSNMTIIPVQENNSIQVNIGTGGIVKQNNATLADNSQLTVRFPERKTFTLVPNAGYEIAAVRYNGADVKAQVTGNAFTSPVVVKNDTLDVSFIKTAGTPELADNRIKVYAAQSAIQVEGTYAGETVTLYTVQGQQLQAIKSQGERTMLHVKQNGIYLVKVGSKTFKVVAP